MDKEVRNELEEIKFQLKKIQYNNDVFIDNHDFLKIMKISKRTAQSWRDQKLIAYSQIGHKIYYRFSDIEDLLNKYYYE